MTDQPQPTDTPPAATAAPEDKAATPPAAQQSAPAGPAATPPAADPAPAAQPAAKDAKPAEAAKPAAAKTILDDGDAGPAAEPADWPSDWRERLAGDDKKMLNTLRRYASPKTFSDAYFNLRTKVSSGELVKTLPENASEEELAEYRKSAGIPAKPEEYDLTLKDGLVIGENDKPIVDQYLKHAHAANLTNAQVQQNLQWYFSAREAEQVEAHTRNEAKKEETATALRQEWGGEYRVNLNAMSGYLDTLGADAKQAILAARDADGTMLINNPAVVKALVQTAREINPTATVVAGTGADAARSIADEIAGYEKRMREDWNGWHRDARAQERYRELLGARERLKARG